MERQSPCTNTLGPLHPARLAYAHSKRSQSKLGLPPFFRQRKVALGNTWETYSESVLTARLNRPEQQGHWRRSSADGADKSQWGARGQADLVLNVVHDEPRSGAPNHVGSAPMH